MVFYQLELVDIRYHNFDHHPYIAQLGSTGAQIIGDNLRFNTNVGIRRLILC